MITPIAIMPGELHLWWKKIAALASSPTRQDYQRWVLSVLSQYCTDSSLSITSAGAGKPFLNGAPIDLRFNLSHSGDWCLLGLGLACELGVDVQVHRCLRYTTVEKLSKRFFADAEWEALMNLPQSQRLSGFYRFWVLKEAFVKATGRGMAYGLGRFEVSLDGHLLSHHDAKLGPIGGMGFIEAPEEGYSAAYVTMGVCTKIITKTQ